MPELNRDFSYQPTPPVPPGPPAPPTPPAPPAPAPTPDLGPLAGLLGKWEGTGFNAIWRPSHGTGSDRFLELNLTEETLEFDTIPGAIPNRGLLQEDLLMAGLRYLQQITDSNLNAGLHAEPGVWLAVPATTDPDVPTSVARLGSVPHGTTFIAQGLASTGTGAPQIPSANIAPFPISQPTNPEVFPEQQLSNETQFRTSGQGLTGIDQAMLDNPNSVIASTLPGEVSSFTELTISSDATTPILGGGTSNTAFLQGGNDGPNAQAARVDAIFWLLTMQGQPAPSRLLYTQTVLLNFNGISWPHVSVASLALVPPGP